MISPRKKILWWVAASTVSVGILTVLFFKFDFDAVLGSMEGARRFPLFLALINTILANLVLSAWQWRIVFSGIGYKISLLENIFIKASLYPLRLAVPFRGGDLGRPVYLARAHDIPMAKSIAATLFILIVNFSILLILSIGGFLASGRTFSAIAAIVLLAALAAGLIHGRKKLMKYSPASASWISARIEELKGITRLNFLSVLKIVLLGLATISAQILEFALISDAFQVRLSPAEAFHYVPIVILAGSIPISLMGIGVRETAALIVLAKFAAPEKLISIGLTFTALDQILLAFLGLITLIPFISACRTRDLPPENAQ